MSTGSTPVSLSWGHTASRFLAPAFFSYEIGKTEKPRLCFSYVLSSVPLYVSYSGSRHLESVLTHLLIEADSVVHRSLDGAAGRCECRKCSCGAWIAPDGAAYRRYMNASTGVWSAFELMPLALDAEGVHFGYHLATGWASLETCIATAWLHRAPGSRARVRVLDAPPTLDNLAWGEGESELATTKLGTFLTARFGSVNESRAKLGNLATVKDAFRNMQEALYAD